MSRLAIVQNISREGPGTLLSALEAYGGIPHDLYDLSAGDPFPKPKSYDALVVLGGPTSANDTTKVMRQEIGGVQAALEARKPYLGVCLGMQVLVLAAGGGVVPADKKEVGFLDGDGDQYTIKKRREGREDRLFYGLPYEMPVFQLHGETVELTDDMTLLATAKHCRNQAVKVGENAYGLQAHIELTQGMLKTWARQDPDLANLNTHHLLDGYQAVQPDYGRNALHLFENFLTISGFFKPPTT